MEMKHESDLTPREKRQMEIRKIKSLPFRKKIPYLWTYYKSWLVILLIIIAFAAFIVTVVRNRMTEELISVGIEDTHPDSQLAMDQLEAELLEYMGTGEGLEKVSVDGSFISGDEYTAMTKRMTTIAAGDLDVFICGEDTYQEYKSQNAFREWSEVLGDSYEKYEQYMTDGTLDLSKCPKWQEYGITLYEPVYAIVFAPDEENNKVLDFLEFFCQ